MKSAIALAALLIPSSLWAEGTTAAFLKIGVGARPVGMGSAYTALADGIEGVAWNPAGLSRLRSGEFSAMDAQLYLDTRLDFAGFARPMGKGTLGGSALYLSQGSIEGRGDNRERTGSFTASDAAVTISYARPVTEATGLGIGLKVIQSEIANVRARTVAADFGAVFGDKRGLSAGIAIRNLGPGMRFLDETSPLPLAVAGGLGYALPFGLTLSADYSRDIREMRDTFSLGTEYSVLPSLALRAGYLSVLGSGSGSSSKVGRIARPGMGAGLGIKVRSYRFDYSFQPFGELGNVQRISISARY